MSGPPNAGPGPDIGIPESTGESAPEPERELEDRLPAALRPAYRRYQAAGAVRERFGPRVAALAELLVAAALLGGFGYWLYLYSIA